MRFKVLFAAILLFVISCGAIGAEIRTYRQFKDVSTKEDGKVSQSGNQKNLFEYTYSINRKNKTITRTNIRRLDEAVTRDDATVYTITEQKDVLGSEAGRGGKVLVAVQKGGGEILELGSKFAFTTRTSPFSQVITGVYKRVYIKNCDSKTRKH